MNIFLVTKTKVPFQKKKEKHIEEYTKDVFKFGEVVHAPPTVLTLPRKATKSDTVPRVSFSLDLKYFDNTFFLLFKPGMKDNLILKTMFNKQTSGTTKNSKNTVLNKSYLTKSQLKGKRKDLPIAARNMLETEQLKMIQLYRELRKNQINKNV